MDNSVFTKICPGCAANASDSALCPICGFDMSAVQDERYLPYNTFLSGRYVIGDILEQSSDGVTYLARDTGTDTVVRVREFFPEEAAARASNHINVGPLEGRSGDYRKLLGQFVALWNGVRRAAGKGAVMTVFDVFESGGTAYAVTEAAGSETLRDYLNRVGTLTWAETLDIMRPVMEAAEALNNEGVVHGAVSPDTIFMEENGGVKLWGYSVIDTRFPGGVLSHDILPGYAAAEQYDGRLAGGEKTDVYALGACFYRCITGTDPLDSEVRMQSDTLALDAEYAVNLPEYAVPALVASMNLMPSGRTASVAALRKAFEPAASVPAAVAAEPDYSDAPVLLASSDEVPVLSKNKTVGTVEGVAPGSVVLMALCVVFVMLIFFAGLTLAGVISFNLTGVGKNAAVFEMPDFTNLDKSDPQITKLADKYNLHITLQPDFAEGSAENIVFAQDIAPGTQVAVGSDLTLSYARGAAIVSLPNLTGLSLTEAVYYMGRLNVKYNITEKPNDGSGKAGYIASMNPSAGSSVYEGSEVTIEVWGTSAAQGGSGITSSTDILDSLMGQFRELF